MARAMPVLPLVGSRIVSPVFSSPAASAARIIHTAGPSLMEPVGLRSSSLAQRRTCSDGESRGSPTSGVLPHASSRLSYLPITTRPHPRSPDDRQRSLRSRHPPSPDYGRRPLPSPPPPSPAHRRGPPSPPP